MMKYGEYSVINWYSLHDRNAWELILSDGAYGSHSYFPEGKNLTFAAQLNPATPIISMP